jgi:hypothetical protein
MVGKAWGWHGELKIKKTFRDLLYRILIVPKVYDSFYTGPSGFKTIDHTWVSLKNNVKGIQLVIPEISIELKYWKKQLINGLVFASFFSSFEVGDFS